MARAASQGAEQVARGAAARSNSVVTRSGSAGAGWKTELTAGARLTERRERSDQLGRREQKGKMYFHKDATDTRVRWGRGAGGADWAKGRVGR
jgi:hypothetical protein